MGIRVQTIPEKHLAAIIEELIGCCLQNPQSAAEVGVSPPHFLYAPDLEAVAEGQPLKECPPRAARYLVFLGDEVRWAAEIHKDQEPVRCTRISAGPYVTRTVSLVQRMERLEQVQNGDWELRLLRIREISFAALWLKGMTKSGGDLVFPMSRPFFRPGELVQPRLEELIRYLQRSAERIEDFKERM